MTAIRTAKIGIACAALASISSVAAASGGQQISSKIWIARPPNEVWAVLTDTAEFPSWNPSIQRLDGDLKTGGQITVEIGAPGQTQLFHSRLLDVTPNAALRWQGGFWPGGLFDAVHGFTLTPQDGGTLLVQSEQFTGLLVGIFTRSLIAETETGFAAMNEALKRRVEGGAPAAVSMP
jgi:hypothetical protein